MDITQLNIKKSNCMESEVWQFLADNFFGGLKLVERFFENLWYKSFFSKNLWYKTSGTVKDLQMTTLAFFFLFLRIR